jgi:hypothetical protein
MEFKLGSAGQLVDFSASSGKEVKVSWMRKSVPVHGKWMSGFDG